MVETISTEYLQNSRNYFKKKNMDSIEKKYYKISEVADILEIPVSTLRYWEDQFTVIKPKRTERGTRLYTSTDIEKIRMVNYLVKERGMKIEAAQKIIKQNRSGVSKQYQAVERLRFIREELVKLLDSMKSRKRVLF